MARIETLDDLRRLYQKPGGRAMIKVISRLDTHARRFIALSPFFVLASSGRAGGCDASPRGEGPGFVHVLDDQTLVIPDRPGNNRLDTLENLLNNDHVGLLFFIPGVNETLRVNGRAEIRDDADLLARFDINGKVPASVLVVHIDELYLHCAKALMRSGLWLDDAKHSQRPLPSMGQMINDQARIEGRVETEEEMLERYRTILY